MISIQLTIDGRTTTATFSTEARAEDFERRAKRNGGTTKRVPFVMPLALLEVLKRK